MGSRPPRAVGTQDVKEPVRTIQSADPKQKNNTKTELIMSRLTPSQSNGVTLELRRSLKNSRLKLKEVPNFLQLLANSPAALRAYIRADAALVHGQLTVRQRKQVALAVAEINGSSYSLSAHYDTGKRFGLTHHEMQLARNATATDPRTAAMLGFTQSLVLQRGEVSDDDFQALVKAGFTNEQIVEIVANIALNIFSNYFNSVAKTEVDFPVLKPGMESPRVGIRSTTSHARRFGGRVRKTANGKRVVL